MLPRSPAKALPESTPDTNGASVTRTGMKDAEALEQIDQTTAAAAQGNEAETARNGQVGQTDYAQQSMTQLFQVLIEVLSWRV